MSFDLSWMAWTWHTGAFFIVIALLILSMGVWEWFSPGGNPRDGILGLNTTRGDRLFVSLLGAAFIHLAWLGLTDAALWWALVISGVYAVAVFRYV
jgi:predicted small integral membrane protein